MKNGHKEMDWIKLIHLMQYLWKMRFLPLILLITHDGITIYIDGDHAAHADLKGHSGLYATQGRGAMINVNSSTEAQGDNNFEDVLMQDNKSFILLQKNWPFSTNKGSKHNSVCYFFCGRQDQE